MSDQKNIQLLNGEFGKNEGEMEIQDFFAFLQTKLNINVTDDEFEKF